MIRTSYAEMLSGRKSITLLTVTGMHVSIPPRGVPRNLHPRNANQNSALVIDRVVADDGIVEFLSGTPRNGGTRLDVRRLELEKCREERIDGLFTQPSGIWRCGGKFIRPDTSGLGEAAN